ncbi:MAG: tRNA (adenosine(37)-N6)-threonylcarbamoyltransferase complex ATPase subunit type 1 TsaE [Desulfobulbaceae bacterium]|nr:tRNA (adenosine(37)-N6)-threonylcarbamoyltransferase complex ATPase subunit type 1 TsaE [Desulfobulbaceae bacterium]
MSPVYLTAQGAIQSLNETETLGIFLGKTAEEGDVILLKGDLGAGKTTLTQAIARGLDVPEEWYVTSPSFALMHEYSGRISLYHIDCYRLAGEDDVEGAGLTDYLHTKGICVIEWPDRLGSFVPKERLEITMAIDESERRKVSFSAHGASWVERLKQLMQITNFFVSQGK